MKIKAPWARKNTSKPTTEAAPATQEAPVAKTSTETVAAVINVVGLTGDERWVFPRSPRYPMPRTETVSLNAMPEKNCAIPAGWYYPEEFGSDEEIVIKFSDEYRTLLCLAYTEPAINIQYVTFRYERNTGTVFATAWGYDHNHDRCWQTAVQFDVVQTFSPYVAVVNGQICMDAKLCGSAFIAKLLHGSLLRTRVTFAQTYETAEQTYSLLIDNVACIIAAAAQGEFKRTLQIKATRHYASAAESVKKMQMLINDAKNLVAHAAVKRFYGIKTSEAEFNAAQTLFNRFVQTTNELDNVGDVYYYLVHARKMCGITLDLSQYESMFDYVGTAILELNGLFEILRG